MKRILLLVAVLLLAGGATLHYQQWDVFLWQHWKLNRQSMPEQALNLGRYRVDIEAVALEGVGDDLSALTFNAERNSLFGLLNGRAELLEISLDGQVLRRVRIEGVKDMEGLTHIGGNRYVIAEERHQRLRLIELPEAGDSLDVTDAPRLTLAIDEPGNKAFEGLSWDARHQHLLLVRERDPLRVMIVDGFVNGASPARIDVTEKSVFEEQHLFVSDLSSVVADEHSGHLLLLSDESHMVVEYDRQGKALSLLGLRRGFHGLQQTVPQAEGLAIDAQRRIYVVSEPNLFYRFVPLDD